MQIAPMPSDTELAAGTDMVRANAERMLHLEQTLTCTGEPRVFPVPAELGLPTPIEHVVLLIRENKTYDKIRNLIPQGAINDETRLILTNTIYFKANWTNQFDEKNTHNDTFKLSSGTEVTAPFMHETSYYNYGATRNVQIIEMDYQGDDLSMLIILPKKDKMNDIESEFNKETLEAWKNHMEETRVSVSLPKFKFETKYFMRKDLKAMGMPTAFIPDAADFSGMNGNRELFISHVIHQAYVDVNEEGTEAAAATGIVVAIGAVPPENLFVADHPFIFLIVDKETGEILFMGRLSDPSKTNS